jgi:hypothetical protein
MRRGGFPARGVENDRRSHRAPIPPHSDSPLGSGLVNEYDVTSKLIRVYAPIQMAPFNDGNGGVSRFGHHGIGGTDCRDDGPFGSYTWSVTGNQLTLTAKHEPWGNPASDLRGNLDESRQPAKSDAAPADTKWSGPEAHQLCARSCTHLSGSSMIGHRSIPLGSASLIRCCEVRRVP